MSLSKRIATLIIAGVLIIGSAPALTRSALANDRIVIILDGQFLSFTYVDPQIINDRVMVPARELGEALGALVNWDPNTGSVLLTMNHTYATLRVGVENMIFGEFETGEDGEMVATSVNSLNLESPPVIRDDRTLFPLHAIAYAFGIPQNQLEWRSDTRTVIITRTQQNQIPQQPGTMPTPGPGTPTQTPAPAAAQAFPNTDFYREMSGRFAQDSHDGARTNFGLIVFDGNDQASISTVQRVINTAARAQFLIYGIDLNNTSGLKTNPDQLTWIWNEMSRSHVPFVALSFAGRGDSFITDLTNEDELFSAFENMAHPAPRPPSASPTPSPSPSPTPSPTPGATPTPSPGNRFSWQRVELRATQRMFEDNRSFAVFIYGTNDWNAAQNREKIERIAEEEDVPVYFASSERNVAWIETTLPMSQGAHIDTPLLIIVRGRNHITWVGSSAGGFTESRISQELWQFRNHLNNLPSN